MTMNPHIWTFLSQVTADIKKHFDIIGNNNITFHQQETINQLQKNGDITIKMADKGGNVVVMDTTKY